MTTDSLPLLPLVRDGESQRATFTRSGLPYGLFSTLSRIAAPSPRTRLISAPRAVSSRPLAAAILLRSRVGRPVVTPACCAAVPGTTTQGTAARRTATGTIPRIGTTTAPAPQALPALPRVLGHALSGLRRLQGPPPARSGERGPLRRPPRGARARGAGGPADSDRRDPADPGVARARRARRDGRAGAQQARHRGQAEPVSAPSLPAPSSAKRPRRCPARQGRRNHPTSVTHLVALHE